MGASADCERAQDGFADLGFFGGTTGYENWGRDLKRGTANFVYLVGTGHGESRPLRLLHPTLKSQAEPRGAALPTTNSFAQATYLGLSPAQSEMWTLAPYNSRIVPAWVNADERTTDATIVYLPHSRAFALVGDIDMYKKKHGDAWETVSLSHLAAWYEVLSVFAQTFTFEEM